MLKTKNVINRKSGGTIPIGAVITYSVTTQELSNEVTAIIKFYYSLQSLQEGMPPIPLEDISSMEKNGQMVRGCKITPEDQDVQNATTLVGLTDSIVMQALETEFFGADSLEAIGIPEAP